MRVKSDSSWTSRLHCLRTKATESVKEGGSLILSAGNFRKKENLKTHHLDLNERQRKSKGFYLLNPFRGGERGWFKGEGGMRRAFKKRKKSLMLKRGSTGAWETGL